MLVSLIYRQYESESPKKAVHSLSPHCNRSLLYIVFLVSVEDVSAFSHIYTIYALLN